MKKKDKIGKLINQTKSIYNDILKFEKKHSSDQKKVHPLYKKSAKNLFDYISLRRHNIRDLQNLLGEFGFSRLGRCENHVRASLLSTLDTLSYFKNIKNFNKLDPLISISEGKKRIATNTKALLGYKSKGRRARIMVTLPSEAAEDYKLVYRLLSAGMNSARINCCHDEPVTWTKMIKNIKKAKKSLGKSCKIIMDLGGPKIRTGAIVPGPKVIHIQPDRDSFGNISRIPQILLTLNPEDPGLPDFPRIPIDGDISKIGIHSKIKFKDSREKNCTFAVRRKFKNALLIECQDSAYITPGLNLPADSSNEQTVLSVKDFPPLEQRLVLRTNDILILHKKQIPGEPPRLDTNGKLKQPAHISCTFPEVFKFLKKDEPIFFDDGKIEGVIVSVSANSVRVKITSAKENGSKLGADKGINLPKSKITFSGLSAKDKQDLKFISKNADVAAISFVNTPKDIEQLLKELKKLKSKLGIIIKIETRQALKNLPGILLTSMRTYPAGIMIARGDLAIECGWQDMAKIQEEILLFCGAAHIPVVWATQVLENLAKKGMPSRAEITDAAMSQRSECVMLNKGPHIIEALKMLDTILKSMEPYRHKMSPMLPALKKNVFVDL